MKKLIFLRGVSYSRQGALSIEAAIVLPIFLLFIYVLSMIPISIIYFNEFEEQLAISLIEASTKSLHKNDIMLIVEEIDLLTTDYIDFKNNKLEVQLKFKGLIKRKWIINYPFIKIPFEKLVYVTDTGIKYHIIGCDYLKQSLIPLVYSIAILKYGECKVCSLN